MLQRTILGNGPQSNAPSRGSAARAPALCVADARLMRAAPAGPSPAEGRSPPPEPGRCR